MKLQKTLVGALVALVTFGALVSCNNSVPKVEKVKPADLEASSAEKSVATDEDFAIAVMGLVSDPVFKAMGFGPTYKSVVTSPLAMNKAILGAVIASEAKDPESAMEDLGTTLQKEIAAFGTNVMAGKDATFEINKSYTDLAFVEGKSSQVDKLFVKADVKASVNETKISASGSASAGLKVTVNPADLTEKSGVKVLVGDIAAEAKAKNIGVTMPADEDAMPKATGTANAGLGTVIGTSFAVVDPRDEKKLGGKLVFNVSGSAKVDLAKIMEAEEKADKATEKEAAKIYEDLANEMLKFTVSIKMFDDSNKETYAKEFKSIEDLEKYVESLDKISDEE